MIFGKVDRAIISYFYHKHVTFSFDFVTFPYSVLVQVWYLIVSILDLCRLSYFVSFIIYHIT